MNPLDVRDSVPPIADIPGGYPLAVQGIPGLVPADAITQNFVDVLSMEVQKANDFCWNDYQGLLKMWASDNAAGIYRLAPGPVWLAAVDRKAAAAFLQTGTGGVKIISYYEKWDPNTPPGTIESAPPPPPPPAKNPEPIGARIPGTQSLYADQGGYTALDVGTVHAEPSGTYVLILSSPVGGIPMWLKQ